MWQLATENRIRAPPHSRQRTRTIRAILPTRTTRRSTHPHLRTRMAPRRTSLTRRSRPRRSSTARMSPRHRRRTRLATISPVMIRRVVMPRATTTTLRTSRKSTLPNHRHQCQSMNSLIARVITTSGRRGIGSGLRPVITGYRERGCSRPMLERCGHPDTGVLLAAAMVGITAIGVRILASTAASITATVISGTATRAATGIAARSITTARLPGSITTFATSTRATSATTTALG